MITTYYNTNLGIVVKDTTIRLKTTYENKILISESDFNNSNPIKIKKHKYLELINKYFRKTKFAWKYDGQEFTKLDSFDEKMSGYIIGKNLPSHTLKEHLWQMNHFIVMYRNRLYYTYRSGNYYPRMQLVNLDGTHPNKWTNIKNLCPVFNKTTKQII